MTSRNFDPNWPHLPPLSHLNGYFTTPLYLVSQKLVPPTPACMMSLMNYPSYIVTLQMSFSGHLFYLVKKIFFLNCLKTDYQSLWSCPLNDKLPLNIFKWRSDLHEAWWLGKYLCTKPLIYNIFVATKFYIEGWVYLLVFFKACYVQFIARFNKHFILQVSFSFIYANPFKKFICFHLFSNWW